MLPLGKFHDKFLDEGRYVAVGDNLALPFLDVENRRGHVDLKVVFDL